MDLLADDRLDPAMPTVPICLPVPGPSPIWERTACTDPAPSLPSIALAALLCRVPPRPRRSSIVALGDSLTAGYGPSQPATRSRRASKPRCGDGPRGRDRQCRRLRRHGERRPRRLDWSVPEDADAVIVELGANDALRGVDPANTREARSTRSSPGSASAASGAARRHAGAAQSRARLCRALRPDLPRARREARRALYPFFLDGVAARADSIRPTASTPIGGGRGIVERILPAVEALIAEVSRRH